MTLRRACEIGATCGLTTTSEAVFNIQLHAISIFDYDMIEEELKELMIEFDSVGDKDIKEVYPDIVDTGSEYTDVWGNPE